jgi:glycosyltransferase involved in cell wall biosynthesis|tara:strand:- start:915 stop:2147 length:1233 start_codon:yes stop_codon:yes gene_type:complete
MVTPNEADISVIIPTCNDGESLKKILDALHNQTLVPQEIVIVDSSANDEVEGLVEGSKWIVPIVYHRETKAYPGRARNTGANLASGEWIAFLDCKTVPEKDWLKRYQHLIQAYHADVVFGVTQFDAASPFQKVFRAATYGKIGHQTVPGTLIEKKVFADSGGFLEHVRMGEDIELRERLIKNGLNVHRPDEPVVTYHGLPDNLSSTLKKYLTSAYHTARLNILRNVKDVYLSLALILTAVILPKWNHLIGGWDANPLFIPHVTKIYLMALVILLLSYQLVHYLFFRNMSQTVFSRTLKVIVLVFITLAAYRWNAVIAGWMEDAVLYVPHITKIYLSALLLTSIFYRGLFLPLGRKVDLSYLLPFRWIQVSLLGLSLDLFKAPGYLFGAVLAMGRSFRALIVDRNSSKEAF